MHSISTLVNRIIWGKQFIYLFKALNFSQKAVDKQKSAALKRLTQDGMMSGEYFKRSHGEKDPVNTMTPFCISTSKRKEVLTLYWSSRETLHSMLTGVQK